MPPSRDICFLLNYHGTPADPGELCDEQLPRLPVPYIDSGGSVAAEWGWFPEHRQLEFVNRTLGFDTSAMGLRCGDRPVRLEIPPRALHVEGADQRLRGRQGVK